MSKGRGRSKKPTAPIGAVPLADAERTGATPLASGGGGGGSTMGAPIVEGTYLQRSAPTFVESPFGERYIVQKPRAIIKNTVLQRSSSWSFDVRGYQDIGVFTLDDPRGIPDGETLLKDWYPLVRDMGKRTLKYKHLPLTLTDYEMLIHILNVYYYVIANMTTLLNLNRLAQYNPGFAAISTFLPRYMSRITRLWRRTSALPMPPFIKAHAIRNGMIVMDPEYHVGVVRLWTPYFLLPTGSGGPAVTDVAGGVDSILAVNAALGDFVANLEVAERWLEIGTAAISDDFAAVKDLIDMSYDIVPGTFVPGLPNPADMPGITILPSVTTDLLFRAVFRKDDVDVGTDQWEMFPVPSLANLGNRIPIVGRGSPTLYDFILLGAPKFGVFEGGAGLMFDDVDSICRIPGTDFWLSNSHTISTDTDVKDIFGSVAAVGDESLLYGPQGTPSNITSKFIDCDSANAIRELVHLDSLAMMSPWDSIRYIYRESASLVWERIVEEKGIDYMMWQDSVDLGEHYAEYLGMALGIPYMKGS